MRRKDSQGSLRIRGRIGRLCMVAVGSGALVASGLLVALPGGTGAGSMAAMSATTSSVASRAAGLEAWLSGQPVHGTRVATPTSRPAGAAPLSLVNAAVIDPNGNVQSTCTAQVQVSSGSLTFPNFSASPGSPQGCAARSWGFSVNNSGPPVGSYTTGRSATFAGTCNGISLIPLAGAFKVTQATYDSSGHVLSFAVIFKGTCPQAPGAGNVIFGTLAYNMVNSTPNQGYYLYDAFGQLYGFGNDDYLMFLGNAAFLDLNSPILSMVPTPDGGGYWMMGADGGIFTYGDAGFYGSTGNLVLNKPAVGMAATPDGRGYWFVASDGGIFSFGDAGFYGSAGGMLLNKPVVGMTATPDGRGYLLVSTDGGIFTYGDASFFGSTGGMLLNQPIVGMATDPVTGGYWLVASDGGIYSFNAPFFGSTGNLVLAEPIVGMAALPDGSGYWFVASDGGIFSFNTPFYGSLGGSGQRFIAGMAS